MLYRSSRKYSWKPETTATLRGISLGALASMLLILISGVSIAQGQSQIQNDSPTLTGIHKIRYVVIIMQENRSFAALH